MPVWLRRRGRRMASAAPVEEDVDALLLEDSTALLLEDGTELLLEGTE